MTEEVAEKTGPVQTIAGVCAVVAAFLLAGVIVLAVAYWPIILLVHWLTD